MKLAPIALWLAVSCAHPAPKPAAETPAPAPAPEPAAPADPFAEPSTLPFQLPPFDRITDDVFAPAFEHAMAEQRAEIDAIAHSTEPPTFENTLLAMERSGQHLTRVSKAFFNLAASNTDDTLQAVEADLAPKLAAHEDAIWLDADLFARVDALFQQRDTLGLDPESLRLLEVDEHRFVMAGARLSPEDKHTLEGINQRLSSLATTFDDHVLDATKEGGVVVDDVKQLDGLTEDEIAAAAAAASAHGQAGKWLLTLENTTVQPVLARLKDRAMREKVYRASIGRCDGGPYDNTAVVAETMKLRAQKAALLGYPSYAAYALVDETAGTPEAVDGILSGLAPAALAQAKREAKALQAVIDRQAKQDHTERFELQPWDWAYYAEQVRRDQYSFDEGQVKPYFELSHVLNDGVFYAAHALYGVTFTERHDLPVYEKSVKVYEVDGEDGKPVGLLLLDYYQRDGKQGGAWMDNFVDQSRLLGQLPVVVNNVNLQPPGEGQPTLLTFDEVETIFHEFGHALHGLFTEVNDPTLSNGTPPDFVEYPSQFNEMWARDPGVLANYAKRFDTGEPMPKDLLDKVLAAQRFDAGYDLLEYLEAAQIDMAWHEPAADAIPAADGVMAFEQAALDRSGMAFAPVPPRYHTPYFSHVFNGGYAAGYYAYVWSEVLARDTGAWFESHGGLTRANGQAYRDAILSRGWTVEPSKLFADFNGGPPTPGPLLEYRGVPPVKPAKK